MHRFKYTTLTKDQIGAKLRAAEGGPKSASAFTNALTGKTLKIVTADGPTLQYTIGANRRLTLTECGKQISAGLSLFDSSGRSFRDRVIPCRHGAPSWRRRADVVGRRRVQ